MAATATLSIIAFLDKVEQFTASPLEMIENTSPGCTAFVTGNGSLPK